MYVTKQHDTYNIIKKIDKFKYNTEITCKKDKYIYFIDDYIIFYNKKNSLLIIENVIKNKIKHNLENLHIKLDSIKSRCVSINIINNELIISRLHYIKTIGYINVYVIKLYCNKKYKINDIFNMRLDPKDKYNNKIYTETYFKMFFKGCYFCYKTYILRKSRRTKENRQMLKKIKTTNFARYNYKDDNEYMNAFLDMHRI